MSFVACWRSHSRELARLECGACKGGRRWLHSAWVARISMLMTKFEYVACYKISTLSNWLAGRAASTLLFVVAVFVM